MSVRMIPIPELTEEEIAKFKCHYVERGPDECWPWEGSHHAKGYGWFSMRGKSYRASRVALAIVGERNDTLQALHHPTECNNPRCVNPNHLRFGTQKDNSRDTVLSGNGSNMRGSKHGMAKLWELDIILIRGILKSKRQSEIATLFKVSRSSISDILTGKTWKHVTLGTLHEACNFLLA